MQKHLLIILSVLLMGCVTTSDSYRSSGAVSTAADRQAGEIDGGLYNGFFLNLPSMHIEQVLISPDGSFLATSSNDGTVRLWDSRTGELLWVNTSPAIGAVHIAFSPDSSLLAMTHNRKGISLWRTDNGKMECSFDTDYYIRYRAVSFNRDGTQVAGVGGRQICIWDLAGKEKIINIKSDGYYTINNLFFLPHTNEIAVSSTKPLVEVWNLDQKALVRSIPVAGEYVDVDFSNDGSIFAVTNSEKELNVYDFASGDLIRTFDNIGFQFNDVEISPDNDMVGFINQGFTLLDLESGDIILKDGVTSGSLSFSPDGRKLLYNINGEIKLYDFKTGEYDLILPGRRNWVRDIGVDRNGSRLFVSYEHGAESSYMAWNLDTLEPAVQFGDYDLGADQFNLLDKSSGLVGRKDKSLFLYDYDNDHLKWEKELQRVYSMDTDSNGRYIVAGGNWINFVDVLDGRTGDILYSITPDSEKSRLLVAISRDGSLFAYGSLKRGDDFSVVVSDVTSGEAMHEFTGIKYSLTDLMISDDGNYLFATDHQGNLYVWDLFAAEKILEYKEDYIEPSKIAYHSGKGIIALGFRNEHIVLYDLNKRKKIHDLHSHWDEVTALVFSYDGETLISGSQDSTVRLWNVDDGQLKAVLYRIGESDYIAHNENAARGSEPAMEYLRYFKDGEILRGEDITPLNY